MGAGKLVSDASVHCPGGSAFFEPRAHDLSDGRVLLRPADNGAAFVVLARKPGMWTDGPASEHDEAVALRTLAAPARLRARFSVGALALWLLRPLDADYELSPLPSRPDLSVNLALVRAAFSALVAYTPDAVRASTEARAEAVPVEGIAVLRVAVGTAVFCVMPVIERATPVDWTPGEWVLA